MRLFISLPLDDAMRRSVQAIAGAVMVEEADHDVRWVAPDNLHITLKFLGQVNDAEVPAIASALGELQSAAVRITAGAPDPRRHKGRVHLIAVEVHDDGGHLIVLQDLIERALEPLGFAREKRAFWPHVTIGRSRRGVRMRFEPFAAHGVVATIDRFELMSSTPGPEGSLYVPLARFPLGERE
jgi:2'-5' RNA ligase